jgi:hypothetical protein
MARDIGKFPTEVVATREFELRLMADTEAPFPFATNAVAPFGVIAIALG